MSTNDSTVRPDSTPGDQLTGWLTGLVRSRDYGQLASLRRPRALTTSHIVAAAHAPTEEQREIFEQVAFLFAIYHRGASRPSYGFGTVGLAARRIGSPAARGPKDPGACRLVDRLVSSRRIPWRHLQHTVERLRVCEVPPPAWRELVDDLTAWSDKGRRVHRQWASDFHINPYTPKGTAK
ncbi:type I-E CRISPR-associated protein Cse2/CasB [Streptomyces sp. NPDC060006]|uniref:type I-E CRISPR-associated protein Cse2/CasB n=1 Tax=unclassified Streptomyces TaxID=2593676 RepID=UPI0022AC03EA|nr:type I-E CRISPR-associated protein Cse2/CasB [Streptomyces aurantiacus]WAU78357.1 type I-E CRISPR-associated protein Cse2/CasB [Streptomyces aurantiacus]